MRLRVASMVVVLSASAFSCASVYDYRYSGAGGTTPAVPALAARLAAVLEPHGFARLSLETDDSIPQSGPTGYHSCPDAHDLVVFLRENAGRTSVHLFACRGEPRFVVVADSWVRDEPSTTSDLISREFAAELDGGAVVLKHRHRLALE